MPPRATSNTAKSTRGFCSTIRALRGPDASDRITSRSSMTTPSVDVMPTFLPMPLKMWPIIRLRGGLAVGAGDRDDRDPGRRPGREHQVHHRFGDVLRLADRRVGVHPETGCGVDLADAAAGLADRLGDVGADEVDAGDVETDHPGRLLGDVDVVRVRLEGPVDRDATGRHVARSARASPASPAAGTSAISKPWARTSSTARVVDRDPGQHLLVPDTAAGIGVGQLDEFGDGVLAVTDDVGRHPLGDGDHVAADHQHPVVLAGDERLDEHRTPPGLVGGRLEGGPDLARRWSG